MSLEKFDVNNMFDYLGYCTRFKHMDFKVSHGAWIVAKGSKICGLLSLYSLL